MDKFFLRKVEAQAGEFNKGYLFYSTNRVLEYKKYNFNNNNVSVYGKIKESKTEGYNAYFEYNADEDDLLYADCDCGYTDYYSDKLCSHSIALILHYNSKSGHESDLQPQTMTTKNTSYEISSLLYDRTVNSIVPLAMNSAYVEGKVHLTPYVAFDTYSNHFSIDFKIGIEKDYVVKSIEDFVYNVKEHKNFKYGKNLEFIHSIEAFDDESQNLVKFLVNYINNLREFYENMSGYSRFSYYTYAYFPSVKRNLNLQVNAFAEFLLAMGSREFYYNNGSGFSGTVSYCTDKIHRVLEIDRVDDGISLSVKGLQGVKGNSYYVYFYEGRFFIEPTQALEKVKDFIDAVSKSYTDSLYIAEKDIANFCRILLPDLKKIYDIKENGFDEREYLFSSVEFKIYLDSPQKDLVSCKIMAVYGEEEFNICNTINSDKYLTDSEKFANNSRDLYTEATVHKSTLEWFNAFNSDTNEYILSDDEEGIYKLLTEGIIAFQRIGEVYISDALKKYEIKESPSVEMGISLEGNLLELKVSSPDMTMDELAEILSKYKKKKKFYRLKNGKFIIADDKSLEAIADMTSNLGLSENQLKKGTVSVPKYRTMYFDELMKEKEIDIIPDDTYTKLLREIDEFKNEKWKIPKALINVLRKYQVDGFRWIKTLSKNGFGGILADDMGLGKTLQIITYILSEYEDWNQKKDKLFLIVTPASLVFNWKNEFDTFAPQIPVVTVAGKADERERIIKSVTGFSVLITSYDLIKRDVEFYENISFYGQVIDEAQFIKNHGTQAAQAVKKINSGIRFALTGTPIENRVSEIWSIFDYLMPGILHSYMKFRGVWEVPIMQCQDEHALENLKKIISPFILRRLKKDVLKDLPDKIEKNMYASISGEQKSLYDAHVKRLQILLNGQAEEDFNKSKIQVLSELTRLRQLCCDPTLVYEDYSAGSEKKNLCLDIIKNAIEGGHKVLLFSQFTTMLDIIKEELKKEAITYYSLTGSTEKTKRIQMVNAFNNDDTNVFCISLKAGGTGLNLTSADVVIHYDPWWNVSAQNQATDRAHRIGQNNVVTVYRLVAKGTIEDKIIELQDKKLELANQLLSGDDMGSFSFNREEILALLK